MIQVVLLGSGNVATHLAKAFAVAKNVNLKQIYGRSKKSLKSIDNQIDKITHLNKLVKTDVYVLAISDDAIADFSNNLPIHEALVVHTSGSVSMNALPNTNRKGVFYPLQTFSKATAVNFKKVPVCIEAEENKDLVLLEKLASSVSDHVYFIDSNKRKHLHLSAVMVNNFVNHLYHCAYELCQQHQVPFEVLKPLIRETADKIVSVKPYDAQTGPAKRDDKATIEAQLSMLTKTQKEIYKVLTKSIQKTYGKKL